MQVSFFLRGTGLFGYVTGEIPPPPAYLPEYAFWVQQDCAIVSCLMSSLSAPILPEVVGKRFSREIWESLQQSYATTSTARLLNLKDQLKDLSQGDLSVSDYLTKAKSISDELAAIDKAPDYQEFLVQVLGNLHPDLHGMRTSILARPHKDFPGFEEVRSLLISAESMHRRTVTTSVLPSPEPPAPTANVVQRGGADRSGSGTAGSGQRGSNRYNSGRFRNITPGSRGRAPNRSRFSQRDSQRDSGVQCQICSQRDHIATTCPQRLMAPGGLAVYSGVPSGSVSSWHPDT